MKKIQWTTIQKTVGELIPQKINPRKITNKQMSDLKKSLEKFGLAEIPACDIDGTILAGNQRIKALKLLGQENDLIDIRVPNRKLTNDEVNQYLIGSNALGGDWDFEILKSFDIDLLLDVGFDQNDLANIWDEDVYIQSEQFNSEKELAKTEKPMTKPGDIIILGEHKLICGNSNDPNVVRRLFRKEKASMVYSDPIYNINLDYNKGLGGKQNYGGNVIDKRSDEEYIKFLGKNIKTALTVLKEDAHIFYWNTEQQIWIIQTLYRSLGINNKRVCLWVKNGHNPTPQVAFNKCYEPCVYGTTGSPYLSKKEHGLTEIMNKEITSGNNSLDELNIWTSKRLSSKDYSHATSKPVELHEKAIMRCTKPGDIILDSFGGSGSTLIAGEQLKRKVYMVELEPIFCDLIIRRFEKMTGKKAKIIKEI